MIQNKKIKTINTKINQPKNLPIINKQNHIIIPSFIKLNNSLKLPKYKKTPISQNKQNTKQNSTPYY